MVTIGLAFACLTMALAGFWMMHRVDRFFSGPDARPYWDEDDEQLQSGNSQRHPGVGQPRPLSHSSRFP